MEFFAVTTKVGDLELGNATLRKKVETLSLKRAKSEGGACYRPTKCG